MTQSPDESRHIYRVRKKKLENAPLSRLRRCRAEPAWRRGAPARDSVKVPVSPARRRVGRPTARRQTSDAETHDDLVAVAHHVLFPLDVLQAGRLHFALRAEPH